MSWSTFNVWTILSYNYINKMFFQYVHKFIYYIPVYNDWELLKLVLHILSFLEVLEFLLFSLQGVEIEKVVNSGPGLVFITYPEVVLKLPGGPIWAVAFFLMLVVCNMKFRNAIIAIILSIVVTRL